MTPSQDYPRMLFHRTKEPVVIQSREEEDGLGPEWSRIIWPVSAMAEPAPIPEPEPRTEGSSEPEPEKESRPADTPHRPARIPIRPPDRPAKSKPAKKKR